MRKVFILFVLGSAFLFPCFPQNMLMLGGEYNLFKPGFWGAGAGFNLKLFDEYIQNDFMVYFGNISAKEALIIDDDETEDDIPDRSEPGDSPRKFLIYIRDSLFFTLEWKWVGLRTGLFASLGAYNIANFPKVDLFLNPGGFVGISIMPKSLISATIDLCPGYAMAFNLNDGIVVHETGFSLSVALAVRLNLDKL